MRNVFLIHLILSLLCVYHDPKVSGASDKLYPRSSICPLLFGHLIHMGLFLIDYEESNSFFSFSKDNQFSQHFKWLIPFFSND